MNSVGHFALVLAWALTLFGFIGGIIAGRTQKASWIISARRATVLTAVLGGVSLIILAILFVNDEYSNQYVWQFSNRSMPNIYKVSAIWGGMDGSMLLWAVILSLSGAILALQSYDAPRRLMSWVLAIVSSSSLFFFSVVLFFTNPFRALKAPFIPPDGNGLNPLLQNPFMAIHPPTLYIGFTTLAIPYAFCMGALLSGNLSNDWLKLTRRWTLVAWGFLTAGIIMGGYWAYIELGWGGFWAWDPVENASFLPWLTATAFLHSVMVQERKNMLRFWNVWLVTATYALTVFGTFLTRSGVVQSVHAFASTDIGWVFLVYLGVLIATAAVLTYKRREELRSERVIESFFSREAAFLLNNLLFLTICFATLWGVMFPVLSEAITGTKQTVGIPFFNKVNVPLFLMLIFMMAIGPLIAWRKASWGSLRRTFLTPFVTSFFIGILIMLSGIGEFYPILSYSLCAFVVLTVMGEMHRGYKVQRASVQGDALNQVSTLVKRHRIRYGGFIVHLGVAMMTVAITASMAHKVERDIAIEPGGSYEIGKFRLTLQEIDTAQTENYEALRARVLIEDRKSGDALTTLRPEMRVYFRNKETTSEVSIKTGILEDLYLVLGGMDPDGKKAALKIFINPLQVWLWVGSIIMIAGTGLVLLPSHAAAKGSGALAGVNQTV